MQPSKRQPLSLPFSLQAFKCRSFYTTYEFSLALFYCQQRIDLRDLVKARTQHNRWLTRYKALRMPADTAPFLQYPSCLRVRSGQPVHAELDKSLSVYLNISHYTDDLCSFDYDPATHTTTLVIDDSKLVSPIIKGYYRASLAIDSPLELWNQHATGRRLIFNDQATCLTTLVLSLDEFVAPLESKAKPAKPPSDQEPLTFRFLVEDFKRAFNIE